MNVERRSIFCIRYMPTLRTPVAWSFVITAGSVMNGAGSSGQQRWIGKQVEVDVVAREHELLAGGLRDLLRHRVGDRLELPERAHLVDEPLRRLQLEDLAELVRQVVELLDPEGHAHPLLGAELVDQQRVRGAFRVLEQERGAAGLDDAVDDLRDLEVGVDLGGDADELAFLLEEGDPCAQVGRRARHAASV